jgi:ABC-2 type transport system permease protein
MNTALRAEVLKLRTTRTTAGVLAGMVGVVLIAIALHALGLPADRLSTGADQRKTFLDVGSNMGMAFAALIGALSMTVEFRYGTIRPTLLSTPRRGRVVVAKAWTALVVGSFAGMVAAGLACAAGTAFLGLRGMTVDIPVGQYVQLVLGGAAAGAAWATIGLGVGSVLRSQVPAVVGLLVWILFVENVLIAGVPSVGKFSPGALGRALAGQQADAVRNPAVALILLTAFAMVSMSAGLTAATRRDVA